MNSRRPNVAGGFFLCAAAGSSAVTMTATALAAPLSAPPPEKDNSLLDDQLPHTRRVGELLRGAIDDATRVRQDKGVDRTHIKFREGPLVDADHILIISTQVVGR